MNGHRKARDDGRADSKIPANEDQLAQPGLKGPIRNLHGTFPSGFDCLIFACKTNRSRPSTGSTAIGEVRDASENIDDWVTRPTSVEAAAESPVIVTCCSVLPDISAMRSSVSQE